MKRRTKISQQKLPHRWPETKKVACVSKRDVPVGTSLFSIEKYLQAVIFYGRLVCAACLQVVIQLRKKEAKFAHLNF